MKNISLNVAPYNSYMPAPAPPMLNQPAPASLPKYSVSLSAQFDAEAEALRFASFIIRQVNEFKDII